MMNLFPPRPADAPKPSRIWKALPVAVMTLADGYVLGSYRLAHWSAEADADTEFTLVDVLRQTLAGKDFSDDVEFTIDAIAPDGCVYRLHAALQPYDGFYATRN